MLAPAFAQPALAGNTITFGIGAGGASLTVNGQPQSLSGQGGTQPASPPPTQAKPATAGPSSTSLPAAGPAGKPTDDGQSGKRELLACMESVRVKYDDDVEPQSIPSDRLQALKRAYCEVVGSDSDAFVDLQSIKIVDGFNAARNDDGKIEVGVQLLSWTKSLPFIVAHEYAHYKLNHRARRAFLSAVNGYTVGGATAVTVSKIADSKILGAAAGLTAGVVADGAFCAKFYDYVGNEHAADEYAVDHLFQVYGNAAPSALDFLWNMRRSGINMLPPRCDDKGLIKSVAKRNPHPGAPERAQRICAQIKASPRDCPTWSRELIEGAKANRALNDGGSYVQPIGPGRR